MELTYDMLLESYMCLSEKYKALHNDYDRLKAEMVAMLEDLDLQIDESAAYNREYAKIQRLIRDRIDKLKGDK